MYMGQTDNKFKHTTKLNIEPGEPGGAVSVSAQVSVL